jgi:hypothetical protein
MPSVAAARILARFVSATAARRVSVDATGHESHPDADDVLTALEQQGRGDR